MSHHSGKLTSSRHTLTNPYSWVGEKVNPPTMSKSTYESRSRMGKSVFYNLESLRSWGGEIHDTLTLITLLKFNKLAKYTLCMLTDLSNLVLNEFSASEQFVKNNSVRFWFTHWLVCSILIKKTHIKYFRWKKKTELVMTGTPSRVWNWYWKGLSLPYFS